jgi:hypothetical protein
MRESLEPVYSTVGSIDKLNCASWPYEEAATKPIYWLTWNGEMNGYLDSCLVCRRTKAIESRQDARCQLQPLPIPARPFPNLDRHEYDAVFAVVDRLNKRPIFIPCHKTTSAQEMAWLYYTSVMSIVGREPDTMLEPWRTMYIGFLE